MLSLGPVDAHKDDKPNTETGLVEWPSKISQTPKNHESIFFNLRSLLPELTNLSVFFLKSESTFVQTTV